MKVTRRQLATSIATAAAAVTLPQPAEPQQQAPSDPELQTAKAALQAAVSSVRALELPMAVEPATRFATKG
jgi:hypothetical protein